jgi:ATP-dependent RNA helicase RhlE
MSFAALGLSDALTRAVADKGYAQPTPIQLRAIPAVLEGRDLLGAAQTGTGKTAAFVLPILQRLMADQRRGVAPRVLILVPTRELAAQVAESVRDYGRHLPLRSVQIFGGVSARPQEEALRRGVDLVIATPGRLLDHAGNRVIDLSKVQTLVLDEADRMLDMGFIRDIKRVLQLLPRERQNLLFSATFSKEIRELASGLLKNPLSIDVAPRNTPTELVDHRVYHVEAHGKQPLLSHILRSGGWQQTLVFTRTKHGANKLAAQLERDGIKVDAIHGNKSQNARTRALADFKANKIEVLVATDIAARGLDIIELPHVVNYELPHVPEDYVHRIGRTGRAGCTGEAISLVARDERDRLQAIERVLGRKIPVATVDAASAAIAARPAPAAQPQQQQQQHKRGTSHGHAQKTPQGRHGNPRRSSSSHSNSHRRPA